MQNNKLVNLINIWNSISRRNKILIITMLIMLLAVVPLTIVQSLQQQETRQRAAPKDFVRLKAHSSSTSYFIDDTFNVYVDLENPNKKDISAVDVIIKYNDNGNFLELSDFDIASSDFTVVQESKDIKSVRFVGIRMDTDSTSEVLPGVQRGIPPILRIGTLKFKASKETNGTQITFENPTVTASESEESLPVNPPEANLELQSYLITSRNAGVGSCIEQCMISMGAGSSDDASFKQICANKCTATPIPSPTPSQSQFLSNKIYPTDQKCADFDPQGFATCKTPPNGNMSCWLPSCSADKYCAYTLNLLAQNDSKCSSLWASPNTTTPASAAIPTATTIPTPIPTSVPAPTATPTPTPFDGSGGDND